MTDVLLSADQVDAELEAEQLVGYMTDDFSPAAPPGSTSRCTLCSLTIRLAPLTELEDGTTIHAWRHVGPSASPTCSSTRATGPNPTHRPQRGARLRLPEGHTQ